MLNIRMFVVLAFASICRLISTALPALSVPKRLFSLLLLCALGGFPQPSPAAPDAPASTDSAPPTLAQLAAQFEEPLIATAATSPEEDAALLAAIQHYQQRQSDDDYQALTGFLDSHPDSGWQVGLLTNLGLAYYEAGRFSLAIDAWEKAWRLGKNLSEPHPVKLLVDRALGELMRMHARIGHAERLTALFAEMGDRSVSGPATEDVTGAREGLWQMQNNPGIAYLCGPTALKHLLLSLGVKTSQLEFLNNYRSGPNGVSLSQVGQLAQQAKIPYTLIKRDSRQAVPVPSVVHWKVSHYAAIIGEQQGRYHIQDPIFGQDLWVSRDAIDSEASGYYLVPSKKLQSGWQKIQLAEADKLYGMGQTADTTPNNTTPQDDKSKPECPKKGSDTCPVPPSGCSQGMCTYNFTEMVVSLNLTDTPIGYQPPKGPAIYTTLTYNQREAGQPENFSFFNVSQKWSLNWLGYIEDNPSALGTKVTRHVAGGGSVDYSIYNSSTHQYAPETKDQSVLALVSSSPSTIRYERRLADGSVEVYAQSNGSALSKRLVFLSQLIDADGNSITLNYDSNNGQPRLTSITDASGRNTTFSYGLSAQPLLITQITDPFGRSASLSYDSLGRLVTITDVIGLQSSFQYDSASLVNSMTTAYGTTTFSYDGNGVSRTLQATDPLGNTERLEMQNVVSSIPFSDPPSTVPTSDPNSSTPTGIIAPFNQWLQYRNTYYWDKSAYTQANQNGVMDYTKSRIKHWVHWMPNGTFYLITSAPVESIKYPLENRIWFNYPGQPTAGNSLGTAASGSYDQPNRQARVLDDGKIQLLQYQYNSLGNLTDHTDPQGRHTRITYAANQIDPLTISQQTGTNAYTTLAQYTYNSQHLPLSHTDAAGQTTSYQYNSAGQLTQATDSLNQTTTYTYDNLGYLTSVTNANHKTQLSLTYDAYGRVASRTDSEGYTLQYQYDALDRLTQITYPDGTTRSQTWDKLDLASVTDRQGRTTQYSHDAVRNLTAVTDPLLNTTHYGYYPNQSLKSLTDPNNHTTSWSRDIQSRVTAKQYDDATQTIYAYENTTSRLKSVTDALGQVKNYAYAKDDRLAGLSYSNTLHPTPNVSFSHDPWFPRVAGMSDGTGLTQYQYQPPGQPGALQLSLIDGPYNNDTIGYQYDALGRISTRSIDSSSETYAYDSLNRLSEHHSPLGDFSQTYLGETGQLTAQQIASGLVGTSYQYDDNLHDRRLLDIQNIGAARSYHYATTAENDISQISETAPANSAWPAKNWTYGYDANRRLTQASVSNGNQYNYSFDAGDNLTGMITPTVTTSFSVNNLNQIDTAATANSSSAYHYDANGNLTEDSLRTYQWDAENRLVQVTVKSNGLHYELIYDGLGRMVATTAPSSAIPTIANRYLWCGERICQIRSKTNDVLRRYYSEGVLNVHYANNPLTTNISRYYYNRDHLGSVRDVQNIQTGNTAYSLDYDAYGKTIQSGPNTFPFNPAPHEFQYANMFYVGGLYLTHHRLYDPGTGRWLSRDPIGENGGVNLYTYVGNNPLRYVDPLGLRPNVDTYPTADAAAVIALLENNAQSIAENREYSGAVYQLPGENVYRYTESVPGGEDGSPLLPPDMPNDASYTESYHTHGADTQGNIINGINYNNIFSPADINIANATKKPNVMINPAWNIQKYDPRNPKTGRKGTNVPICKK